MNISCFREDPCGAPDFCLVLEQLGAVGVVDLCLFPGR